MAGDPPSAAAPARRSARAAIVTLVYAAIVVWGATLHEPWRDEVVPLSIARQADGLAALAAPLRFEGHPIGWYLVLWILDGLVGAAWVLKAASVACAVGAVFLVQRGPLPWWLALPFTFSFFPLYQYSVVSRGYALEMLVLFALCALLPHRRDHPLAVGVGLAALANTEAFGLVMAVAAAAMLVVDAALRPGTLARRARDPWVLVATAVLVGGTLAAALVAWPDPSHYGTGFRQHGLAELSAGVARAILAPAAHSAAMALVPLPSLWTWAYVAYLARTPPLAVFVAIALVGFETIFHLAHGPGAAWHVGNVMLVLVAAVWLDAARTLARRRVPAGRAWTWLGRVLALALLLVLADHVRLAATYLRLEARIDASANRRLAEILHADPRLADAVVMGEPDAPLWSLPYYADHRIYLAREGVHRDWGVFAPPRRIDYDLGALLAAAQEVHAACGCPVVVTLGLDPTQLGVHTVFRGTRFAQTFTVTARDRDAFLAATERVAALRQPTITDERYDVYVLR